MKNIFVGNLDTDTTEASLRSIFLLHGNVEHIKLMKDRATGFSRGFAFVEMANADADLAIAALNGSTLDGRILDVHEGRPRLHLVDAPRRPEAPPS